MSGFEAWKAARGSDRLPAAQLMGCVVSYARLRSALSNAPDQGLPVHAHSVEATVVMGPWRIPPTNKGTDAYVDHSCCNSSCRCCCCCCIQHNDLTALQQQNQMTGAASEPTATPDCCNAGCTNKKQDDKGALSCVPNKGLRHGGLMQQAADR